MTLAVAVAVADAVAEINLNRISGSGRGVDQHPNSGFPEKSGFKKRKSTPKKLS